MVIDLIILVITALIYADLGLFMISKNCNAIGITLLLIALLTCWGIRVTYKSKKV